MARKSVAAILYNPGDSIPGSLRRVALISYSDGQVPDNVVEWDMQMFTPGDVIPDNLLRVAAIPYNPGDAIPSGLLRVAGGLHYLQRFQANVGAAGSFDPTIVLAAGAPTPVWTVVDGAGTTVYNTAAITHVQSGVGNMSVSLGPPSILGYITNLSVDSDGLLGIFSQADLLRLPALTLLSLNDNLVFSARFSLSALSAAMTSVSIWGTVSAVTGLITDLGAAMRTLTLTGTGTVITGKLNDLHTGLVALTLSSTSSVITGGASAMSATGVTTIAINTTGRSQAQVDEVIARIYADRALFTYATPTLNIGGSNAAPSGIYQVSASPASGKEMIYRLVNPTGAEKPWTITYTT